MKAKTGPMVIALLLLGVLIWNVAESRYSSCVTKAAALNGSRVEIHPSSGDPLEEAFEAIDPPTFAKGTVASGEVSASKEMEDAIDDCSLLP